MKFYIVSITLVLLLCFFLPFVDRGIAQSNVGKIPLSRIWEKERILDMVYLKTRGQGVLCIATSYVKKVDASDFTFEKLIFYKRAGNLFTRMHEFEPGGGTFVGLYPLYNGDLMALWAGASAFGVFVFSVADQEIRIILQEGGVKTNPEIADIDNDGLPEILVSSGSMVRPDSARIEPETTYVYKRTEKSYVLVKTVPWERRFDELKPKKNGEK